MRDSFRDFPPYEGDSSYLYFAFAEADSKKVREYMRLLYERGCRVWYSCGKADGPEEVLRRQERYRGSALTMVYLSDEACRDQNTKSSVLVNQKFDSPIVCLDPDGKDRVLAMGLRESVPHIPLYRIRGREALEDAACKGKKGQYPSQAVTFVLRAGCGPVGIVLYGSQRERHRSHSDYG